MVKKFKENKSITAKNKKPIAKEDMVFEIINDILLVLITLLILYPLLYVVSSSISDPHEVYMGNVSLLPKGISFKSYQKVLSSELLMSGYLNTLIIVTVGTTFSLALTMSAGYVLSRKDFEQRKYLLVIFMIPMFFGGGMVSTFITVKNLGILDTFLALILPGCLSVWNVIVVKTTMSSTLPWEIQEAAMIDGCSDFMMFFRIVIPLTKPILAVMVMYYGIGYWNNYSNALLYISDKNLYPLQMVLRELLIKGDVSSAMGGGSIIEQAEMAESIKYSAIVVSTLPVLFVYPFMQRFFETGITVGSVKG